MGRTPKYVNTDSYGGVCTMEYRVSDLEKVLKILREQELEKKQNEVKKEVEKRTSKGSVKSERFGSK